MTRAMLFVLFLSFSSFPVQLQSYDIGLRAQTVAYSCGKYLMAYEREKRSTNSQTYTMEFAPFHFFFTGLITGFNLYKDNGIFDILDGTDYETLELFVERHCQNNPLTHIADGALQFIKTICESKYPQLGPPCYHPTKHLMY